MLKAALVSTLLVLTTALAQAAPIVNVSATTAATEITGFDPLSKTLDFTNLTGNTLADLTDSTSIGWVTDGALPVPITITYSLNAIYQLSQFGFWNLDRGNDLYGFEDVFIEFSADGLNYNPLTGGSFVAGVHTFTQAPLNTNNAAELVTFNQVMATNFRFTVLSNFDVPANPGYSPDTVGYNTIMFDGLFISNVPELSHQGAGLGFAAVALLGLAATRRKRPLPN